WNDGRMASSVRAILEQSRRRNAMRETRVMRLPKSSSMLAVAVLIAVMAASARAQMFGPRQLGGSLSRRPAAGGGDFGSITGYERFLRENRGRREFVGSAADASTFVGTIQGA